MDAFQPEELPLVFQHYFNAGDVAGLMAHYYAPDPTYAPVPGVILHGVAAVEEAIGRFAAQGQPMDVSVRHVLRAGDTALLVVDWEVAALDLRGTATDVARLQEDRTWRCLIDNPHGGALEVTAPAATLAALGG